MLRRQLGVAATACLWRVSAASAVVTMSIADSTSFADQVLYFTYQGLANRNSAQVWYIVEGMLFWTYAPSTPYFANWLASEKGYTFTNATDFCTMYTALPNVAQGIALYNASELDASTWLAVTDSGLRNLLPLTVEQLRAEAYSCLQGLPVAVDYRGMFSTDLAAYDWALTHLMPRCAKDMVYSAGHTFNDSLTGYTYLGGDPSIIIGLDLAVARGAFVFNLSPDTGKYPDQADEWGKIVAALDPGRLLFGWAEPEPTMTYSTSKVGGAVVCDGAPNLSFWSHVSSSYPSLPYHSSPSLTLDPSKYYVMFQTNEGDTPKILAALQQGTWTDGRRGTVPIAWGIDPLVADFAPGLLEYYALTATGNDTWFAGTAGAGYSYPWLMQPQDFDLYTARAGSLARNVTSQGWPTGGAWNIDIWDDNVLNNLTSYKTGAGDVVGLFTMQPEQMAGSNSWLPDGTPVVITYKALWYPCQNLQPAGYNSTLDGMEAAMRDVMAAHPPPFFFLVYGCLLDNSPTGENRNIFDYAIGMRDRLQGDGLVVVGAQDMARLARQAGQLRAQQASTAQG